MKKLMLVCMVFALTLVWVMPVQADQLTDAKNKKSTVTKKLDNISDQKRAVKKKIDAKADEKQRLLDAEKKKTKEYLALQQQKNELEELTRSIAIQLDESEQKYSDQKELLKKRLKVMYENSSSSYLQTLIESKSIIDFYERIQLLSAISNSDSQLVKTLDEAKKDVEYKKQIKEQEKLETQNRATDKATVIKQISVSRADVEGDLKEYQSTLDELEKQEDALIKQSDAINKQIKSLMSKAKYSGGIMRWPSASSTTITSGYGMRYHPILKKTKMHTGIDIGAAKGTSILAAAKGTVIKSGWETGYGNTVVIDHGGGIATLYGHASKLLVRVGDTVTAGQTIAKVGSTGWSTGPHLHFEVIKDGSTVSPLKYVTAN